MYTYKQSAGYKYFNRESLIISAFFDDRFYVILWIFHHCFSEFFITPNRYVYSSSKIHFQVNGYR